MACMEDTTSRRGLLGILAAAPLIATPAVATPSTWKQAKRDYLAARAAEKHYDDTVAEPAWQRVGYVNAKSDAEVDRITTESDRLCDIRVAAEKRMMDTPAPDADAVLFMVRHARQRSREFEVPDSTWETLEADLERLTIGGLN